MVETIIKLLLVFVTFYYPENSTNSVHCSPNIRPVEIMYNCNVLTNLCDKNVFGTLIEKLHEILSIESIF